MKKGVFVVISVLFAIMVQAQESQEVYSFLRLPVSAHAAALGGDNISITDDDPTLIFHNPALIAYVTDKSLNLNYMTYMEGCKTASASFVKSWKERSTWGVSAQYMDYGKMKQTGWHLYLSVRQELQRRHHGTLHLVDDRQLLVGSSGHRLRCKLPERRYGMVAVGCCQELRRPDQSLRRRFRAHTT